STDCILEGLTISLEENIAVFDNTTAKQISGTAMGPHHSCSYADIAVDYAIDSYVMSDNNPWKAWIGFWGRFRDDIYCPWLGSKSELFQFDEWLNNLDPHLFFTIEVNENNIITFLDLELSIVDNKICTKITSKACDSHSYLLPSSCHPSHICRNIPKGIMQRVKRNCSDESSRAESYKQYASYLRSRYYGEGVIQEAISLAEATPIEKLLGMVEKDATKSSSRKYPLVIKFNPKLPPMAKYMREHAHILSLTPETDKLFNINTLFVTYKIEKNIRSLITKNKFKSANRDSTPELGLVTVNPPNPIPIAKDLGCYKCDYNCTLCKNYMLETKTIFSPNSTQTFVIKDRLTCQTKNVIYMIIDKLCPDVFYVGYTSDDMRTRWRNHKSHIKKEVKSCELSSHFTTTSNSIHKLDKSNQSAFTSQLSEQISVYLIERVEVVPEKEIVDLLRARENFWQAALKSCNLYGGINKRTNKRKTRVS
ncbi:MAG: GIY-YIG nuclease family protein, partial [Saccharospirillaceae bacterium]|nr:GIY-YIG nuclease family protein [Saccharospirillaceae bacterium]